MIKRAKPTAGGNNPVCELYLKDLTAVMCALKKEGCLNNSSEFISSFRYVKSLLLKFRWLSFFLLLFLNFCESEAI